MGAILIAPLVKVLPTRTVLGSAVIFFALMTTSSWTMSDNPRCTS